MNLPPATPHGYRCLVWPEIDTEVQETYEVTSAVDAVRSAQRSPAAGKGDIPVMVLAAETAGFRQMCRWLVPHQAAYCLEIGSAHGHATKILAGACPGGRVVGVDKGNEFVRASRATYPELTFERMDVLMAPQYLSQLGAGAEAVFVVSTVRGCIARSAPRAISLSNQCNRVVGYVAGYQWRAGGRAAVAADFPSAAAAPAICAGSQVPAPRPVHHCDGHCRAGQVRWVGGWGDEPAVVDRAVVDDAGEGGADRGE